MAGDTTTGATTSAMNAERLGQIGEIIQSIAKPLGEFLTKAIPLVITYMNKAAEFYAKLPQNFLHFLIGFFFCFFGGIYPTLFAAIQAAENGGRKTVVDALSELSKEIMMIVNESKKDDNVDADKDGKKDVTEISNAEYLQRKTLLVFKKMNPEKINNAIYSVYRVWLSVAAVLAIQFAKTINMALSIAEFLNKPCDRFITPVLQIAIPDEYDKWVPVVLRWITKSIAISIAWYIEAVQSAFTSSLIGGLMMARAFCHFCMLHGYDLGGLIKANHEEIILDEILSYVFAAMGCFFQFQMNFKVPFPLNLVFWPANMAEQYIRWSITQKAGVKAS